MSNGPQNKTQGVKGCDQLQGYSTTLSTGALRRVTGDIPFRLWIVASIGFWERAAFWGLTAPWQNYMQHSQRLTHNDTPGALGLGQATATRIYCAFYVGYYFAPIAFAMLSDSKLGRFRTLFLSLVLYNIGCIIMTLSSVPSSLAKGWGLIGLILAMICIALGGGGFQSVMAAFLADQYTETQPHVKILKSGEQVIVDRSLTLEYIYSLNYWLGNIGSLSWFVTVTLEKHSGFTYAYGLTLAFIFISLLTLLAGRSWFIKVPHDTKVMTQAGKILICASRNGFSLSHADPTYQLEHRGNMVPWSGRLVAELRHGLQGCRILLAFIVFYLCFDQMQNNLISQAAQMDTGDTPNDMLPAMNQIGCIIFVPLMQYVIYPVLHKRRIYIQAITRITVGFGFVALSMVYAAFVQHMIYSAKPCLLVPRICAASHNRTQHLVNVWLQAPVFLLIAMGEALCSVTALEIAYSYAPKDMKAVVQAFNLLMAGLGSACAMALSPLAHDPNLVYFYASLAGGMATTTLIFWLFFRNIQGGGFDDGTHRADIELQMNPKTATTIQHIRNTFGQPTSAIGLITSNRFVNNKIFDIVEKDIQGQSQLDGARPSLHLLPEPVPLSWALPQRQRETSAITIGVSVNTKNSGEHTGAIAPVMQQGIIPRSIALHSRTAPENPAAPDCRPLGISVLTRYENRVTRLLSPRPVLVRKGRWL